MKLIKISPKFQITIPKHLRKLCTTKWLSIYNEQNIIILRPVEVHEAKTDKEILKEITQEIQKSTS